MPSLSGSRLVVARSFNCLASTCHSYLNLLQAHEHASAQGQPLLTEAGLCYLRQHLLLSQESESKLEETRLTSGDSNTDGSFPDWDALCRRLGLGGNLLKEFQQPSPNQTRLLDVFQEQGWCAHIESVLSTAKRRARTVV